MWIWKDCPAHCFVREKSELICQKLCANCQYEAPEQLTFNFKTDEDK